VWVEAIARMREEMKKDNDALRAEIDRLKARDRNDSNERKKSQTRREGQAEVRDMKTVVVKDKRKGSSSRDRKRDSTHTQKELTSKTEVTLTTKEAEKVPKKKTSEQRQSQNSSSQSPTGDRVSRGIKKKSKELSSQEDSSTERSRVSRERRKQSPITKRRCSDSGSSSDRGQSLTKSSDSTKVERERHRSGSESSSDRRRNRSNSKGRGRRGKQMIPSKFDGTSSITTFLRQFNICASQNKWTTKEKVNYLITSLSGNAADLISDAAEEMGTFEEIAEKLERRFGMKDQEATFRLQLKSRKRRANESLADLYQDIARLIARAYPGGKTIHSDSIAVESFIDSLNDDDLELRVSDKMPKDLEEAYKLAIRIESQMKRKGDKSQVDVYKPDREGKFERRTRKVEAETENSAEREMRVKVDKLVEMVSQIQQDKSVPREMTSQPQPIPPVTPRPPFVKKVTQCFACGQLGHIATNCPVRGNSGGQGGYAGQHMGYAPEQGIEPPKCYNCNQYGHLAHSCPTGRGPWRGNGGDKSVSREGRQFNPNERPMGACFNCGQEGHFAKVCPNSSKPTVRTDVKASDLARGVMTKHTRGKKLVYLDASYKGIPWKCLLDSGCEVTVIPRKLVRGEELMPSIRMLRAANGTEIPVDGKVEIYLRVGDLSLWTEALVTAHVAEPMLGVDWMELHGCQWNFAMGEVLIGDEVFLLGAGTAGGMCRRIVAGESVVIPAMSEGIIPGRIEHRLWRTSSASVPDQVTTVWMTENVVL
jgi:hypothetical protein